MTDEKSAADIVKMMQAAKDFQQGQAARAVSAILTLALFLPPTLALSLSVGGLIAKGAMALLHIPWPWL